MTRVAVFPCLARNVWIDVNTDPQRDTKLVLRDRRSRQYSLASPNDLRLKTAGPVPIYGTVTVWTVPSTKEQDTTATVVVEGARFHYERRGNHEKLSARGPLLAELVVSVSIKEQNIVTAVIYLFVSWLLPSTWAYLSQYKYNDELHTHIVVIRMLTSCSMAGGNHCFKGTHCHNLQGERWRQYVLQNVSTHMLD